MSVNDVSSRYTFHDTLLININYHRILVLGLSKKVFNINLPILLFIVTTSGHSLVIGIIIGSEVIALIAVTDIGYIADP